MKSVKEEHGKRTKVFLLSPADRICVFASEPDAQRATAAGDLLFGSATELMRLTSDFPGARLVAVWNNIPGVSPIRKFKDRPTALRRIWQAIQMLEPVGPPEKQSPTPAGSGAQPRAGTKKATLMALLGRAEGASVREIMTTLGWQAHSVRGCLSTLSRQNAGIHSFRRPDGERAYSTVTAPEPDREVTQ
jgi:hypothetical protein